jgi:hypothetical protein
MIHSATLSTGISPTNCTKTQKRFARIKISTIFATLNTDKVMAVTRLKRKDRRNKNSSMDRKQAIKLNTTLVSVKSPNTEKVVIID